MVDAKLPAIHTVLSVLPVKAIVQMGPVLPIVVLAKNLPQDKPVLTTP